MATIKCNWRDRYTARYTIVTDDAVTINVTGRTDEAASTTRAIAKAAGWTGPDLPDPVPYSPPKLPARPVREAMPRTAADCLPGDNLPAKGAA